MRHPHVVLALAFFPILAASACQLGSNPDQRIARDASAQSPGANAAAPSVRPADGIGLDGLPQLLKRRDAELAAEQEKTRRAEEALGQAQGHIEELRRTLAAARQDADSLKAEKEAALRKIRERDEMLLSAALGKVEAERDALEARILAERTIAAAAEKGLLIDVRTGSVVPPPAGGGAAASPEAKGAPAGAKPKESEHP